MSKEKVINIQAEPSHELATVPTSTLARIEIDSAIATARQYPRDLKSFESQALQMVDVVSMQKSTRDGAELFYALPRAGKIIEGPSVRLAEIIAHTYGNCRVGARVIAEEHSFIVSQGIFHDLEKNVAITFEVKRRITGRDGSRYNEDMIATTGNAACGIAYRNAVLKGIPKALWLPLYERARGHAGGKKTEVKENRNKVIEYFEGLGVKESDVLRVAGVSKASDIKPEHIATLRGIATAIRDGETTVAQVFGKETQERKSAVRETKDSGPITKQEHERLYSLLLDLKLEPSDMGAAMRAVKHEGKANTLPKDKLAAVVEFLHQRAKR